MNNIGLILAIVVLVMSIGLYAKQELFDKKTNKTNKK